MGIIRVRGWGQTGVNVDRNVLEVPNDALTLAQNAIADPASGQSSVRNRPGLIAFTTVTTAGTVLGGIDLPFPDQRSGTVVLFLGRGPTS